MKPPPVNQGTSLRWSTATSSPYATIDSAAQATAIGAGKNNTTLILAGDSTAPAAKACVDYDGGGMNDWFLPSKDELNEMYNAGTITSGWYWSSSEGNFNVDAWYQNFGNGGQASYYKLNAYSVRAVRAF